ncbi:MAG: NAD(P)H-hydrate dehydratase [Parolsenella sp.]|uniref:NAD(P)H-hydrate dehydratase n=1 Tax=Parolsenella sp. TaxID=2083006 RepID=UPI002A757D47|nr:NAD(P)H-hydrate dehydratase [Parolsenella sp.]MCI5950176.1 NAD(P)H-hydrate dehydratase [Coriobacteriaceae bacterium]MDY3292368.1 NAD(P)H-hydrate dehydratase [Parolsenella sp.]
MQPVLNIEDIRAVERRLSNAGVSVSELMHRAGGAAAQEVMHLGDVSRVVVLAGFGNNGGDGWVAAEDLKASGVDVRVVTPCEPENLHGDLAPMVARAAIESGVKYLVGPSRDELDQLLGAADVVLDAMLGTGFHDAPVAPLSIWIDALNSSGARVVSVDVPSGLSAQTGRAPGAVVVADVTITMLALKPGLLSDDGRDVCGSIVVAPLAEQTAKLVYEADPVAWRCETADYIDVLQPPTCVVDKYTRGSVLVVGGSTRFPGAAIMAAKAAARAGAGYVTLAVPEPVANLARTHLLEIPVVGLPADADGTFSNAARAQVAELAARRSAVLVGPGMCVTGGTVGVVSTLLEGKTPLVVDADGLNSIARLTNNALDEFPELLRRSAPLVLTPHRRELGRLVGLTGDASPDTLTSALDAARRVVWADGGSEIVVVAKGTATACVGVEVALLPKPGPACLATAGSGDVLAGIMAGLLSRGVETENLPTLTALACEVHGCAASIAQERFGSRGVMAADIIDSVGVALDAVEDRATFSGADIAPEAEGEEQ